jgi:hypothetical protein
LFSDIGDRSQCTQQKLQSICAVLTFDPQLKKILTFSVKNRYQLNYFICIKDFNAETNTSLKLNLFSFFITLTPEVQCRLVHQNHVIWRTKITKFWRNENDSKQPYSDYPFGIIKPALNIRCQCTQQKLQSICADLTFDPQLKKILTFSLKDRYQLNYFNIASWMYFLCSGVDGLLSILVIQISHLQIIVFVGCVWFASPLSNSSVVFRSAVYSYV